MTNDNNAFNLLFADLVERLLSMADNPGRSSDFIAEELRFLMGAKTVIVYSHCTDKPGHVHTVRSICPERRRDSAETAPVLRIVEGSHEYTKAKIHRCDDDSVEGRCLNELGMRSTLVLPLLYGNRRVGVALLFDIMVMDTVHNALGTLERLAGILALVLRNADLYANLEDQVADRTALLERRGKELEALLKEVHHRVKNNLQIVMSLLYLKSSSTENEEAKALLQESEARIFAMALVHEEIYRTGNFTDINLADYLPRIADRLLQASGLTVERDFRMEPVLLDVGKAIPCGLIASELIANAVKHAFIRRGKGRLTLAARKEGDRAVVTVGDDGSGFQEPACLPESKAGGKPGVGLSIVRALLDQLHGEMKINPDEGTTCVLSFPA